MPDIDWPEFPKLPDYELQNDGVLVKDEYYFKKLLTFKELYKTEQNKYNDKKSKLEESENERQHQN